MLWLMKGLRILFFESASKLLSFANSCHEQLFCSCDRLALAKWRVRHMHAHSMVSQLRMFSVNFPLNLSRKKRAVFLQALHKPVTPQPLVTLRFLLSKDSNPHLISSARFARRHCSSTRLKNTSESRELKVRQIWVRSKIIRVKNNDAIKHWMARWRKPLQNGCIKFTSKNCCCVPVRGL